MVNKLEQILLGYQDRVGGMKAGEIKNVLVELKPFLCEEDASNLSDEVWSEVHDETDMMTGKLNPSLVNFLKKIFNRLISLAENCQKEEIDLTSELLRKFTSHFSPSNLPEDVANEHFFPTRHAGSGVISTKRTALGTFIFNNVLNNTEERNKLKEAKEKLEKRKEGNEETGQNTANQGNNNHTGQENNQNNNQNTETPEPHNPSPSVQELAEKKMREAINAANTALSGNSIEAIEKAREKLIEIQFDSDNKELQNEFKKNKGQELLTKLDEKEQQIKKPDNNNKNNNLQQIQTKTITEITTLLNQDPKITNNDLSADYQNWLEQIKQLTDLTEINNLKDKIIIDIRAKREDKQKANKLSNDIDNAHGKSGTELLNDLKKIKKDEGDKSFEANKEKVRKLEEKAAQEDPDGYRKNAISTIKANMEKNEIKAEDLDSPELKETWQKLNNGEISEPAAIITAEEKITKKVGEVGAQKRFSKMVNLIEKVLTAPTPDKKSLKELKEKLSKFISSTNIYDQSLYSNQKVRVQELMKRLESSSSSIPAASSSTSPWKIFIPISLLGVLVIATILIIRKRKVNLTRKRKK